MPSARGRQDPLVVDVDGRLTIPEVARLYAGIRRRPVRGYAELGVEAGRAMVARSVSLQGEAPSMAEVTDLAAASAGPCPVRLYRPTAQADVLLVHVHGGGWVTGTLDTTDTTSRQLAAATGCVVASIDYPLSPEATSPAPQQALLGSLRTLAGSRPHLRLDPDRLVLLGDSAGAHLAASATLAGPDLVTDLALLYPAVRPPDPTAAGSWTTNADDPILSADSMRWFWRQFAGEQHADDQLDLLAGNLSTLPRTFLTTASLDVLHDEGRLLAVRLRAAGVEVQHSDEVGTCHGYLALAGAVPTAARTLSALDAWVRTGSINRIVDNNMRPSVT